MNRSRIILVQFGLVLALSLAFAGGAFAQEGGEKGRKRGGGGGFGGFGGGGGTLDRPTLLASEQVRTELKVSAEQAKKLEEVLAAHREAARQSGPGGRGRDLPEAEREKARAEAAKANAELLKKTEAKLAEVLEKPQTQRLDEIVLQHQGPEALVSETVAAALKLSPEQVEKIRTAIAARDAELGKLRGAGRGGDGGGGGGGFEEMREKSEKLRKDAETAIAAVLSKEQAESLTKLKGAPFALDRRTLFRGRGGREGGGGGGGRQGGEGGNRERQRPPADDEA